MNPFDLRGPQFLLFYVVLLVITLIVVGRLRRRNELLESPYSDTPWNDPYRIAFLRGGKNELVRVAVVSLVDRGLLSVANDRVQTTAVGRATEPRKRIEREVLAHCQTPREPKELFDDDRFDASTAEYEGELTRMRLLPDAEMKTRRRELFFRATGVLLFFSITKVVVALYRGRTNIWFLLILTVVALVLLVRVLFPRLSSRGTVLLENVRNLFQALKVRAPQIRPGGASTELVMLAAVYGVGALPPENFVWAKQLFPRSKAASSSSACGSACGSSCGSSSCGGGGCGGGCGGCGG